MRFLRRISGLVPIWLLAACVTINVYFPQAAAETAAKTIVRDVLGTGQGGVKPAPETPPEKGSRRDDEAGALVALVLNVLISPAHAGADININTPAINALRLPETAATRAAPVLRQWGTGVDTRRPGRDPGPTVHPPAGQKPGQKAGCGREP